MKRHHAATRHLRAADPKLAAVIDAVGPCRLAVAEMQGLPGKDLLLGIVVGYEMQIRLRDAVQGRGREGWDGTSTTVQSSSAAAAGLAALPRFSSRGRGQEWSSAMSIRPGWRPRK